MAPYILISNIDIHGMVEEVNHYLTQGYSPLGGVSTTTVNVHPNTGEVIPNGGVARVQYTQAMVRFNKTEE